jgi:hypothetical protein
VTIPPGTEAQILRYYHVEKWRIGTIARQLHVHYDTVARVLAQAGLPRHGQPPRPVDRDRWGALQLLDSGIYLRFVASANTVLLSTSIFIFRILSSVKLRTAHA